MQTFRAAVAAIALALIPAPAALADDSGLVAAYGFEEPGSVAVDSSGSGNNGTISGTTVVNGRFGKSRYFDGVDDRIDVPDSSSLDLSSGMTLEAWVHSPRSGWRTVLAKERAGGVVYGLYGSSDTNFPAAKVRTTADFEVRGKSTISFWQHVAATYDGATLRLYVDGSPQASRAVSGPIEMSNGALRIGGNSILGQYFQGYIDEVKIYNRALSALELQTDQFKAVNVPDTVAPDAINDLTFTVTDDDVRLDFGEPNDNFGVGSYRVYRDGLPIATIGSLNTDYTDANRPAGTYRYTVTALDGAGNESPVSNEVVVPITFGLDVTPPTARFDAGCNGARTHSEIYLTPTVSDDRGSVTARVEVDGAVIYGPRDVASPSTLAVTWQTRYVPDGLHTMKLIARDAAGNETVTDCVWNVDNFAVTATLAGPTNGATVHGTIDLDADVFVDGEPIADDWSGWYPAEHPVNKVRFRIDGWNGIGAPTAPDAPFVTTLDTTELSNGPHTISAEVEWIDFTTRASTQTITINVDNTPPAPTGVTATATGTSVNVSWDPVTATPPVQGYRIYRGAMEIGGATGTSFTDKNVPPGTHRYTVAAVNAKGVSRETAAPPVTVAPDTTPPTVTLDAGCDGRTLSEFVGPIFGTATDDNAGTVSVRVDVDGQSLWGPYNLNGEFHFDWDTRTYANGPHVMKVIAFDQAGNQTVKDCPWTVANSVLTVPITGAQDGGTVSGTVALGFQPKADGAAAIAPAFLEIDGTRVADKPIGPYTYSWDTTKVANGVHTIKAGMYWRDYPNPMATATIQVTVANAAPAPTGLVAAYGFEQTSGTSVTDSSGKGSTGTLSGATWVTGGKFGRALSFDGVNDIVSVPDSNLLDLAPGMTLEAWVKPTTVSGWRTVLLKERPGQLTYALYAAGDSGRPLTEVTAGTQRDARNTAALPVGVWTHLAATYDKSTLRLYVNGTQVASTAVSGTLVNSTRALKIGGNTIWGEYFAGLIDEVRVYERALTPAEIAADKDRAV